MTKYVVQEGKMVKIQESVPEVEYNIFNLYVKDKMSLDDMLKHVDGDLTQIASQKELESFLKNEFLLGLIADEKGVKPDKLKIKVKELLKKY
jgi:hypothetical protein